MKKLLLALGLLAGCSPVKPFILYQPPMEAERYANEDKTILYPETTDIFRAARNCDRPNHAKFMEAIANQFWLRDRVDVNCQIKGGLMLCSRELEWMYRERTPEEQALVERGIKQQREALAKDSYYWDKTANELWLCELLAKDSPKEALDLADIIIAEELMRSRESSSTPTIDSNTVIRPDELNKAIARALLDKAFILIQTRRDYSTAKRIYSQVKDSEITKKDEDLQRGLEVLEEYLAERK